MLKCDVSWYWVMKIRSVNILKLIGWIQIIGGITGLGLIGYLLLQTVEITGAILLIYLIGISLFIFSIYTGNTLVFSLDKSRGLVLTIINQLLQLIQFSILGYGISYSSGAELLIGLKGRSLDFNFAIVVSTFIMSINSNHVFLIDVNLFAVLILVISIILYNRLKMNSPHCS